MKEFSTNPVFVKVTTPHGTRRINLTQVVACREQNRADGVHGLIIHSADGCQWEVLGSHAHAFESVLDQFTVPSITAPRELTAVPMPERRPFCETPGASRQQYIDNQKVMFSACRAAGLDTDQRDEMIEAVNQLLNINITSRTELTPEEMRTIAHAADIGKLLPGWHIAADRASLAA